MIASQLLHCSIKDFSLLITPYARETVEGVMRAYERLSVLALRPIDFVPM
jgi:hypothetical protein